MNSAQQEAYENAELFVHGERIRQYQLLDAGKFIHGPESSALSPSEILNVLTEEVGEVARHTCDAISNPGGLDKAALREEVVQVAAVAIGWVERLNREIEEDRIARNASYGWGPDADVDEDGADCRNYAVVPAPAVIMYHDLYTDEELAERADWTRDPQTGC